MYWVTYVLRFGYSSIWLHSSSELKEFSIILLLFIYSIVSDSLWPHGLQHARLPCPLPSPGACSNSYPLSQWCSPTTALILEQWFFTWGQFFIPQGTFDNICRLFWLLYPWRCYSHLVGRGQGCCLYIIQSTESPLPKQPRELTSPRLSLVSRFKKSCYKRIRLINRTGALWLEGHTTSW